MLNYSGNAAKYYNALNVAYKGSYSKLGRSWEKFNDWETAWKNDKSGIDPEEQWQKLLDLGVDLILQADPRFPPLLKEIPLPPFGIYVLGDIKYQDPAIAIVGTRAATPAGKELARTFAAELSSAGMPIISGLAMGIDEAAHGGAVENGGKTIAVLGTPLNYIYPRQNQQLAEEILSKNGAIISEFPLNQEYGPQNFLIRNRIISGLSRGTLIIEAPEKSGSLATARFTIEQNREAFVIPGPINSPNYKGSNLLIKEGANLVTSPKDIIDFFGLNPGSQRQLPLEDAGSGPVGEIINFIKNNPELTADKIQGRLGLNISEINTLLATLTIKGIIKEINGKYSIAR